jgi:uncharacterized membrane protein YqjE
MSEQTSGGQKGLLESLTVLAATLVAIAHTRLDLLSTDLEEERERLLARLGLAMGAVFCLGIGVVLFTILVVAAFWDTHRLLVLGAAAGLFLAAGFVAWRRAAHQAKTKPKLFEASLAELRKDQQQLTSRP